MAKSAPGLKIRSFFCGWVLRGKQVETRDLGSTHLGLTKVAFATLPVLKGPWERLVSG